MTRRHADILAKMKAGATLWRYSTQDTGYLVTGDSSESVRKSTIEKMIDDNLIEVDMKGSFFRETGGSDEVYKLVEQKQEPVL